MYVGDQIATKKTHTGLRQASGMLSESALCYFNFLESWLDLKNNKQHPKIATMITKCNEKYEVHNKIKTRAAKPILPRDESYLGANVTVYLYCILYTVYLYVLYVK